ncbi:MAG: serine/threonine protein phosphatase, partial [Rhodopirellula bahusiensis]
MARQLLLAVNSFLLIMVSGFLVVDHRLRVRREVGQTRIALAEEAKTLYESAVAVEGENTDAVQ